MPDVSLPPVGELVQITGRSDREIGDVPVLAIRKADGTLSLSYVGDLGLDRVQSWCRVLVVPDTDDMVERINQAVQATDLARQRQADSAGIASTRNYQREAAAAWRAVRGAAIR